jgi:hypothetical protein
MRRMRVVGWVAVVALSAGCTAWDRAAEQTVDDPARLELYETCVRDYQLDPAAQRARCEPLLRPIKRRPATPPSPAP